MSCSPFDLRDFYLKELADPQQRQVEVHIRSCAPCRDELDRLRLTEAALFSLREEEIPQRIAFVSDKIFEPSPWRRAWAAFWGSGAKLGFAGAGMLSTAILVSALTRPVPVLQVATPSPAASVQPVSPVSNAEIQARIDARIDAAVSTAVAAAETRRDSRERQLVADLERTRVGLLLAADELERARRRD